ncbi:AgmX/PglI C-terminal domain-containing protein [Marinobacter sp.]|uniref:AgmX/PglI C-terminal domain-containing protein n=1 Tax=Marinobacter sp. TaxID=50741 RepID=UPI0035C75418|nr:AgmX/PglI C-terminal domain-containing protein [Oleiphilaceae bacterium]
MVDRSDAVSRGAGLPWSRDAREERRFVIIVLLVAALFVPLAVLIPGLDVPDIDRTEAEKIPPRLARLIERPEPVAAPRPAVSQPNPEPQPEPEPQPLAETASKPEPTPEPAPAQKPPVEPAKPQRPEAQTVAQARETASRSGLLAMKDRLASLRADEPAAPTQMQANAEAATAGVAASTDFDQTLRGSGGVADTDAPRSQVAVQGHEVKRVEAAAPAKAVAARAKPKKPEAGERAMSNIRRVFDAQKTALYSMYRRELRQDPTLEGKVLLELVIEPDGSVSACQVVSSELKHPTLEQRIAMRVRLFNFGADNVGARKVRFPIDFLPG